MLKTIKSKIIVLTISILVVLSFLLLGSACLNFKNNTLMMIESCNHNISNFAEHVNKEISILQNNAIDLALMGEGYYMTGRRTEIAEYVVKRVFERYKYSLGGGIWFEPYVVNPAQKRKCFYGFHKNGKVVIDPGFESEQYDYLTQSWYKEIFPKLSKDKVFVWSKPYFDNQGSFTVMTTVGAGIYDKDRLIGISTVDWEISSILKTVSNMRPTPNSFALFADIENDYILVSTDKYLKDQDLIGQSVKKIPWYSKDRKNAEFFMYHNDRYVSYIKNLDNGMVLIVNVPIRELMINIIEHLLVMMLVLFVSILSVSGVIYYVLEKNVTRPIYVLTKFAKKVGKGYLDIELRMNKPQEFAELAQAFNKMLRDIREYTANLTKVRSEKEKMESELSIARAIQYSVLPHTFYPDMEEFDIHATMDTAKEVGGDFYDFYFINPTQFMFLIADVSGKGVPAALFMMTTKTLIKNIANEGLSTKAMIEKINNQICENNEQGFFVTMFAVIVDIKTGDTHLVNCGHNPPLIKRANGKYEYLSVGSNLVLGAKKDMPYKIVDTKLSKDDTIFLYTDGVTEAMNENNELYGEERLLDEINANENTDIKELLTDIRGSVGGYMGSAEQSDDITMVSFKYHGVNNETGTQSTMEDKYTCIAKVENYNGFYNWLEDSCYNFEIPVPIIKKIILACEEIYTNISSYAYGTGEGELEFTLRKQDNEVTIQFVDSGVAYDPLQKADPDISLGIQERPIGGLGIYLVKQMVNDMFYEYKDNKNILTLKVKC